MNPTYCINITIGRPCVVLWNVGRGECRRSFDTQEEAEQFASGVQVGLVSCSRSATVTIHSEAEA